ncbi:oxysterol-binding protein-related protein 3 [Crotalus adamanteus]|uniref:Oxysterol-binding protein-related protein 3 n=1 Tax=Crotalus adamanteus TaxID=8729 RepID=A0AAW1B371_CROAD
MGELYDLFRSHRSLPQETSEHQNRGLVHQISNESRLSIADSLTEFFDAQEVLLSASSSENEVSDDDSYASDISDNISEDNLSNDTENERQTLDSVPDGIVECHSRRRTRLPAPCPNTSNISLWNILRNNIGKDLSKVSMPVGLNEPLNTLQKLCEELEYSELLDKAAFTPNPFERMVYVAAFAVSAYASSYYRAGSKPFNPVLGETYECIREDKSFHFFSEQVSHHPAISACHAESDNFIFWQDIRWKNKFWGKSIEIVPIGTTHVILPGFKNHYEWNKVTSCIHNILNGQRWIEHYGEIIIKNLNDDSCHCRLTFVKTKYWNRSVHDIEGNVLDKNGKVVHRLFGKWHENIYCGASSSANCIWRANPMPKDYEQWYGFTQFALELNELDSISRPLLPPTDTRFRPDQRLLEEGNIEGAEIQKQRIEELQRARRKVLEESNIEHHPRFFRKSADDSWKNLETATERPRGFALKMPLLEKHENGEQLLVKSETYLQILKNKDQRKRLVHEICSFLDSSQSVQEIDALRTENRKLKNANSRLRYKTKDWALKKEEYENEIERLSGEISNYLNVTNFWYEESELLSGQAKRILSEPKKHASTQTDELEKKTIETQTEEYDSRVNLKSRNPRIKERKRRVRKAIQEEAWLQSSEASQTGAIGPNNRTWIAAIAKKLVLRSGVIVDPGKLFLLNIS